MDTSIELDTTNKKKNKNIAIFGGSAILLIAVVAAIAVTVSRHDGSGTTATTTTTTKDAVEYICKPAVYKETCVSTLSAAAGNTTDPKQLLVLTFVVASDHFELTLANVTALHAAQRDPATSGALDVCKELMGYAVDELRSSIQQLSAIGDIDEVGVVIHNLKIWAGATVTYQETCLDELSMANSTTAPSVRDTMKQAMNTTTQLSANSLAILDSISKALGGDGGDRRRLLDDSAAAPAPAPASSSLPDFPFWVPQARRNLYAVSPDELKANPNATVAKDGSGDYTTIGAAFDAVPKNNNHTYFVIYVKEGVYEEQAVLLKGRLNVVMIGNGQDLSMRSNLEALVDDDESSGGFQIFEVEDINGEEISDDVEIIDDELSGDVQSIEMEIDDNKPSGEFSLSLSLSLVGMANNLVLPLFLVIFLSSEHVRNPPEMNHPVTCRSPPANKPPARNPPGDINKKSFGDVHAIFVLFDRRFFLKRRLRGGDLND